MTIAPATLDAVLARVDADLDNSLERLKTLLRIKSISTDPAYAAECQRAAQFLVDDLAGQGFTAAARPTPGHPVVVAHDNATTGPHVLFYGHYDVQPVDPLTVNGSLPVRVSLMLEGEEESGGKNLPPFMAPNADELRADIALVCDTDMWDRKTPSITTMLRGLVGEEIEITCASKDLHSGMFGNAARNPNQVLAEIIASLRAPDGSVTLPGFYDDVAEVPDAVKAQWQGLGFDEKAFLAEAGLSIPAGETARSVLEQTWSRPTCEINGMIGGYTGDGFKTVIPAKASAKISFRLVSGMVPDKIRAAFRKHVQDRIPADCSVSFKEHGGSPAITVPSDGVYLKQALAGLTGEWNKEAVITGSGGSIPVAGEFKTILGMDTLLIGFAHVDDQIHSPNEKYDLESFHRGIRSWVRVLAAFAA